MTQTLDRNFQTGLAISVAIHVVLLLILAWALGIQEALRFLREQHLLAEAAKAKEEEVTLIFPDQLLPQPPKPPPPPETQYYIRTTQNEATPVKPSSAPFISDRNTRAGSEKNAVAGSTLPMPTLDGTAPAANELANRDYKDGQFKNDSAMATPPPKPGTLHPQPVAAATPPPLPPIAQAKQAPTPLTRMMAEMDQQAQVPNKNDRLPLEVRKPDTLTIAEEAPPAPPAPQPAPPTPPQQQPQVRMPEEAPPPIVKAVPVMDDPVTLNTPKPEADAFSPFTRTSKTDGSINQEGPNAVDAEATPMGIYTRQVTDAVGKKWHLYVRLAKDSVTYGRVRFRFFVDRKGTPQDLKILSDARDADPRMRELTLRAILDAQIPPIPADLMPTLDDGRVKIEYEAIVY
ncbi:hypothetical protein SAMN02745166_02897 [Prosthecobacter debontii]|uniref:Uncharacterized protein n=1 Tax=Prosthecobacter debontii TaxID=48467 RepID=A0A1T4YBY9_9BACT|nr:hypothetical protein [Prosthecobacter debontii]SKA99286.1 hypothetical protein SAMN02745166_02897 [Prosthecobacter debontii]